VTPPAGTVGKQAHARVGNRIQRPRQQEHGADKAGGDTENIGVETIPFGLVCVLAYSSPDLSHNGKLIYAAVTYTLLTLLYTPMHGSEIASSARASRNMVPTKPAGIPKISV
jgi:hypothetical protein